MTNDVTHGVIEALGANNLVDVVLDAMLREARIDDDPRIDGPRIDGPRIDGPRIDGPSIDGPSIDGPLIDDPLIDRPLVDDPLVDGPIVDGRFVDETLTANSLVDHALDENALVDHALDENALVENAIVDHALVDDRSRRVAAWIIDPPFDTATPLVDAPCIEPLELAEGSRPNIGIAYIFDAPLGQDASSDETPLVDARVLADALASWKHLRRT